MKYTDGDFITQANLQRLQQSIPLSCTVYRDGSKFYGESNVPSIPDIAPSTDAYTVLQAALNDFNHVHIKAGDYPLSTRLTPNHDQLVTADGMATKLVPQASNMHTFYIKGKRNVTIRDLMIQGTGVLNDLVAGVWTDVDGYTRCSNLTLDNLLIKDYSYDGITLAYADEVSISNCVVDGVKDDGFNPYGCNYFSIVNSHAKNCGSAGFHISDNTKRGVISNCTSRGNDIALDYFNARNVEVSNFYGHNCKKGIWTESGDCRGNSLSNVTLETITDDDVIKLIHTAYGWRISNLRIDDMKAGKMAIYMEGDGNLLDNITVINQNTGATGTSVHLKGNRNKFVGNVAGVKGAETGTLGVKLEGLYNKLVASSIFTHNIGVQYSAKSIILGNHVNDCNTNYDGVAETSIIDHNYSDA